MSASCVTQQFAWMDDDECDVNFNCDHIHIDVANILIIFFVILIVILIKNIEKIQKHEWLVLAALF